MEPALHSWLQPTRSRCMFWVLQGLLLTLLSVLFLFSAPSEIILGRVSKNIPPANAKDTLHDTRLLSSVGHLPSPPPSSTFISSFWTPLSTSLESPPPGDSDTLDLLRVPPPKLPLPSVVASPPSSSVSHTHSAGPPARLPHGPGAAVPTWTSLAQGG